MEDGRIKRMRMRSWRRGTKEMDLILGPFADRHLDALEPALLDAYDALLEENDTDLYAWISGRTLPPPAHVPMLARIRADIGLDGTTPGQGAR